MVLDVQLQIMLSDPIISVFIKLKYATSLMHNLVDNEVIWGADSKNDIKFGASNFNFIRVRLGQVRLG